jgi:mevalonate pyrophosphate decarboxylase
MIIFTVNTQDGEHIYTEWSYYQNYTLEQYENDEITDADLLSEFLGIEFTDADLFEKGKYDSANNYKYWNDTSLVWIETVKEINKKDLATIRRYV